MLPPPFSTCPLPSHRYSGPRLRAAPGQCRSHRRGRLPVVRCDQRPGAFPPATTTARHPRRRANRSGLGQARFFCDEYLCPRQTFAEETAQVPRRARSTRRLRHALLGAVIGSGRPAAETASTFGVWWWLVQRALDSAALTLPNVDALAPRMLDIDEHRYRPPGSSAARQARPGNATHPR
jgi:hypothetical protein